MKKIIPFFFSLFFFNCKKETVDNTTLLLSKTWKMTAMNVLTPLQGTTLEGTSTNWFTADGCYEK